MRVLGVIPARGGSKGVPRKNLASVGGEPLITWTIRFALASPELDRVVVSTDDEEIANVAMSAGADVPFMRPGDLARDDTPTLPVVAHTLTAIDPEGARFDAVCLLQPTSPLRPPGLLHAAVTLMDEYASTSVVSVRRIPHEFHPSWALIERGGELHWAAADGPPPRRQQLPPAYRRDGLIYLTRTNVIRGGSLYGNRIVPLKIEDVEDVNVDSIDDLERLRRIVDHSGLPRHNAMRDSDDAEALSDWQ